MKMLCIMTDGFEDLEAVGTIDLLRRAKIEVDVYALHKETMQGSHGFHFTNIMNSDDIDVTNYDGLFIPGGAHVSTLEKDPQTIALIHHFFEHDKLVTAICAAPTILGRLGYLKNKQYTCYTPLDDDFGGSYQDQEAIVDGNLITGRAAAAVFAFAFAIIEKGQGKEVCEQVKKAIYY